jgi:uncharacterized membrane protein YoaK (UPF0700 family)
LQIISLIRTIFFVLARRVVLNSFPFLFGERTGSIMARGDLRPPFVAILAVALVLVQGAAAQWSSFLTKAVFEGFFPTHVAFYTYEAFQAAAAAPYSAFGTTGTLEDQKRELAAFLANVDHESGGNHW